MYKHVKEMFLTALRSGDYPQGKCALQNSEGYCCLGVLTDLYNKTTGSDHKLFETGLPKIEVAEWAGLGSNVKSAGTVNGEPAFTFTLVPQFGMHPFLDSYAKAGAPATVDMLNDSFLGFDKIADLIEAQIPAIDADDIADPDNSREPAPISTEALATYLKPGVPA